MASRLAQIAAVSEVNLRGVGRRRGPLIVAVAGVAGCVAVLVGVLSIATGFERVMERTASPDAAIVLRAGSDSEVTSHLTLEAARVVAGAPGVARGPRGPQASAELFAAVDLPQKSSGTPVQVPLRGVEPAAPAVRSGFRILAGRLFQPGRHELIVGATAASEFSGLELGAVKRWGEVDWRIVGVFSTGGSAADSELWCDGELLRPIYRREGVQSVHVKLRSRDAFAEFRDALDRDLRAPVRVLRHEQYYAGQSAALVRTVRGLAWVLAALMALCGGFAALSAMFAAVASRGREIATLQAIGFGAAPVLVSVLVEAAAIAIAAGLSGGALAYLALDGFRATTMSFQSYTQVGFTFRVTPSLIGLGTAYALAIGVGGAALPAVRAARLPLAAALRQG